VTASPNSLTGETRERVPPHIWTYSGETELRAKKPDYFHTCITMFDDYTTFDARIPFVPFTGVSHGFIFGTRKRFCSLIANLWLRTRRHTESSAKRRVYMRVPRSSEPRKGFGIQCVHAYPRLIAAKSEKFRFLADTKKKQLLKCERRARRRAAE